MSSSDQNHASASQKGAVAKDEGTLRGAFMLALPATIAVIIYATIYGATANQIIGMRYTILSSAVIFSGTVQFTILGLATTGSSAAIVATAAALSLRNIVLGATIRPAFPQSRMRRTLLSWFLVDEAVGLALASKAGKVRVLLVAGGSFYVAWLAGTVFGAAVGSLESFATLAAAVLPVLFVALAATIATTKPAVLRCIAGAAATLIAASVVPDAQSYLPVVIALGTAAMPSHS